MVSERHVVLEPSPRPRISDRVRLAPDMSPQRASAPAGPGLVWRILFVLVGSTLAILGWALVMSVFLVFIGLPLFIFGLALVQAYLS
jgi:hypothetical protein